jgi:MFS family permease
MAIDAFGTGFCLPFSLLYFTIVGHLPLPLVGMAITVGRLVGVPVSLGAGSLVDRLGVKPVAVASMCLRGLAYGCYLLVDGPVSLFAVAIVAVSCDKVYWAAHPVIVGSIARTDQRDRWFATVSSIRNLGIGAGAAASGAVLGMARGADLSLVVLVNGTSFLIAAALLGTLRLRTSAERRRRGRVKGTWRTLLADREFRPLTATKLLLCTGVTAVPTIVPVYAVQTLPDAKWLASALFTVNCAMVFTLQNRTVAVCEQQSRISTLILSGVLLLVSSLLFLGSTAISRPTVLVAALLICTAVFTFGEMTLGPAADALALTLAPEESRGAYLAFYNLAWTGSSVVVPAMSTVLLSAGAPWVWTALIVVSFLAIAGAFRLRRRPRILIADQALRSAG